MLAFLLSFVVATGITPLVMWLYKQKKWVDDPATHTHAKVIHSRPLPRGGGVPIILAILISSMFLLQVDHVLIGILFGALILSIAGIIDDIYDIHPAWRLASGFAAALIVVSVGIGIEYVTNPFGTGVIHLTQHSSMIHFFGYELQIRWLADMFAILFILWNMNIVNWSKGVDGQLPGFVSIALVIVGLLSYRFVDDPTQFDSATLAFIASGAFAGLLIWNAYPQKILPGYGAGSLAGYFLAVLSIVSGAKIATTLMVLGIPTADAVFTIARRLAAGKSPIWGDRGHLHHKLIDVLGWPKARVAYFYWITTAILGVLALYLNTLGKIVTIGVVTVMVFGFLLWAKLVSSNQQRIKHVKTNR